MNISELARNAVKLERMLCSRKDLKTGNRRLTVIVLEFEGGEQLVVKPNIDTDELVWCESVAADETLVDLSNQYPVIAKAYGQALAWSWEMKNHQGYFDALQLEFIATQSKDSVILQFKTEASGISVFEVTRRG